MFSEQDLGLYQATSAVANEFSTILHTSSPQPKRSSNLCAKPLCLEQQFRPICMDLEELGLSRRQAVDLNNIFADQISKVVAGLEANYVKAIALLEGDHHILSKSHDALHLAATNQFGRALESARQAVMDQAQQYLARTQHDSQDGSNREYERPTSSWSDKSRGLLEAAWQRNQKVNTAEKKKLSEATGLSVRQISIWFANQRQRRNKPYSTPRKPSTSSSSRSTPNRKTSSSSTTSSASSRVPSLSSSTSSSSSSSSDESSPSPSQHHPSTASMPWDILFTDHSPFAAQARPDLLSPSPSGGHPKLEEDQEEVCGNFGEQKRSGNPLAINFDHLFAQAQAQHADSQSQQQDTLMQERQQQQYMQDDGLALQMPGLMLTQTPTPPPRPQSMVYEQLQLPNLDHFLSAGPTFDLAVRSPFDINDAGISDDFWKNIMAETGLTLAGGGNAEAGAATLPRVTIAPAADDWSSIFADMDFSAFMQPQERPILEQSLPLQHQHQQQQQQLF